MPKSPKLKITLLDLEARLESRIGSMRDAVQGPKEEAVQEEAPLSGDDAFGNAASELYQQELDLALLDKCRDQLTQVKAALHRIDAGTYGICVRCHQVIGAARLEAIPETAYCRECEADVEVEG